MKLHIICRRSLLNTLKQPKANTINAQKNLKFKYQYCLNVNLKGTVPFN